MTEDDFVPQAKPREVLNILATIEVSKGEVFFPQLTIVERESRYYLIQHKLNCLPSPSRLWNVSGTTGNYDYVQLQEEDASMIIDTIEYWDNMVGYKDHLNPYTFIYSYILGKWNVDLIDIGVFDV